MAKKKRAYVAKRRAKAKPKLEPIGGGKVRLTMEFYIEELVTKVIRGGGPVAIGCGGCSEWGWPQARGPMKKRKLP